MKLICKRNGKQLKVGSRVTLFGGKGIIDSIEGIEIGVRCSDGIWEIDASEIGAVWDEQGFVDYFFKQRERAGLAA